VEEFDVLVVGGGPAGLSAGLWLARYRRHVRILDSGKPRNDPTWAVHGYPGLIDPPPHELRRLLIEQASSAGAEWEGCSVTQISGRKSDFTVSLEAGQQYHTRRVVLAYGRRDILPEIPGLDALYGTSVFHCADCDGPSVIAQRVAVIGHHRSAAILALFLLTWAKKVTLLTNGAPLDLSDNAVAILRKYDVEIVDGEVAQLCSAHGRLSAAEFKDGDAVPLDALFFHVGSHPASDLADQLGCARDDEGNLQVDNSQETTVPGIYAAGDLIGPPYLAVSAAAKGVKAALSVHKSLLPPDQEI
jgi:thioredoxin reductase